MRVLITGGAGYIGSHVVREAIDQGHQVVVIDDLSHGYQKAVDSRAEFVKGNVGDYALVTKLLKDKNIQAVMHFAANIEVAESVSRPDEYYHNNVTNSLNLLKAMKDSGVNRLVFSSTAAVYGNPEVTPILEDHPRNPVNPYGRSKMMIEMMIEDFAKAFGLGYTLLRYFNVAGAHPNGDLGEDHIPESHLIPRILAAALSDRKANIYGTDYPTPDGTCIRDYVHVMDLAKAHLLALDETKPAQGTVFNLGSEKGFSVREIISACERVTSQKFVINEQSRRAGDPAILIAKSEKARKLLKWQPQYSDIDSIIAHAWQWHSKNPKGYRS
ncbi:UDP-glucose 4-epimerase GalE [Bdellovibrio sp. HCB337]|uniref:UDP-glucose 4-epimerase GalE n=1 Tax=Bdellovibrio sp. HCB337 TaxID=3394358 RepID=UPI0039A4F282